MSEPIITLPETPAGKLRVIGDCQWRLKRFAERDAYGPYDYFGSYSHEPTDVIQEHHIYAINNAMRARSSRTAWAKLIDKPLPELSSIPYDLDLIDSPTQDVNRALASLRKLVDRMAAVPGIKEMAASKILYLLRPNFIAIADGYVRDCLGIRRSEDAAYTMIQVQEAIRELGSRNRESLAELQRFANSLPPVTGRLKPVVGQSIPVRLSKVRILDILIWTEMAIHGSTPHPEWSRWYADEVHM